jgi:hypothetical protein
MSSPDCASAELRPPAIETHSSTAVVALSSTSSPLPSCAAVTQTCDAASPHLYEVHSNGHMAQALLSASSLTPEQKVTHLFAALVRNKKQEYAQQLLHQILWGAMLRAQQQTDALVSTKQHVSILRDKLLAASDNAEEGSATPRIFSKQELISLHKEWSRLSSLFESDSDDRAWACWAIQPAFAQTLNRDKMLALARQKPLWEHWEQSVKYSLWFQAVLNCSTAKQVTAGCEAYAGQITRGADVECLCNAAIADTSRRSFVSSDSPAQDGAHAAVGTCCSPRSLSAEGACTRYSAAAQLGIFAAGGGERSAERCSFGAGQRSCHSAAQQQFHFRSSAAGRGRGKGHRHSAK